MTYNEWIEDSSKRMEAAIAQKKVIDSSTFYSYMTEQFQLNPDKRSDSPRNQELYSQNGLVYSLLNSREDRKYLVGFSMWGLACANPSLINAYNAIPRNLDNRYALYFLRELPENVNIDIMLMCINQKLVEYYKNPENIQKINDAIADGRLAGMPIGWQSINYGWRENEYFERLIDFTISDQSYLFMPGDSEFIKSMVSIAREKGFLNANKNLSQIEFEVRYVNEAVENEKIFRKIQSMSDEEAITFYKNKLNEYRNNIIHQKDYYENINDLVTAKMFESKIAEYDKLISEDITKDEVIQILKEWFVSYDTRYFKSDSVDYSKVGQYEGMSKEEAQVQMVLNRINSYIAQLQSGQNIVIPSEEYFGLSYNATREEKIAKLTYFQQHPETLYSLSYLEADEKLQIHDMINATDVGMMTNEEFEQTTRGGR